MPQEPGSPEYLEGLLRRCRAGDEAAWCDLVNHFQALVFTTARSRGLSREEAEDVMQITFVSLYRSLDTILAPTALPKWLYVTASREAERRQAELIRQRRHQADDLAEEAKPEGAEVVSSLELIKSVKVRTALDELPIQCRELLTALYCPPTLSYKEVSEKFGIPLGSIGPTRARCLDRLRKSLIRTGYF